MNDNLIKESKEIVQKAITDHQPYAIVGLFSGGSDSLLVMKVLEEIGVKLDFTMHIRTGTGLPQTLSFVRDFCNEYPAKYVEADSGNTYEKYVLRKGFFGRGLDAHAYAYHVLKVTALDRALSFHIRNRVRNRKILLLNGIRVEESENRKKNFGDETINIYPRKKNDVWVNVIHWWTDKEKNEYLEANKVEKNPVSIELNRSGECMCGTMQSQADRIAAANYCPAWGKWLDDLERKVIQNGFPWRWGQTINKHHLLEMNGQLAMWQDDPMFMCVGCKAKTLTE